MLYPASPLHVSTCSWAGPLLFDSGLARRVFDKSLEPRTLLMFKQRKSKNAAGYFSCRFLHSAHPSLPNPCSLPASFALQELLLFGELSMYVPLYVYLGTVPVNVSLQFRWKADSVKGYWQGPKNLIS